MILHREVMQQNREKVKFEGPAWFKVDLVAQRYAALFEEFDWTQIQERDDEEVRAGRLGHTQGAYLRGYLVMVEEKIESMSTLRSYLCEHPALVWTIGYRLVVEAGSPYGFGVTQSVPSAGHLGRMLRWLSKSALRVLLKQSAQRVLTEDGQAQQTVILDVKHQYACVRNNNLRHEIPDRFKADCPPRGDTDCRLGFKAVTNQGERPIQKTGKAKGDYVWGYGSGLAVAITSTKEAVVLGEHTLPFNTNDVEYAPALLEATLDTLDGLPAALTADAAFDAQTVYAYFVNSATRVIIPLNLRGKPHFRFTSAGQPLCPIDQTPLQAREVWLEHGQRRQHFRCPLCQHDHKLFVEPVNIYRWQLDRDSPAVRRLYRQRTTIERVNSLADAAKLTYPRQRRLPPIAHRNTLIYISLNLHLLHRLRLHKGCIKPALSPPPI